MGRLGRALGALLVLVFACTGGAAAQAVKGSLVGNVTDSAGLVLPGVGVTITETNTNISSSTTTNESGYYVFSNLKDGTYRVVSELAGVKRVIREGVQGPVNSTVRVDMRMEVGPIQEPAPVSDPSLLLPTY